MSKFKVDLNASDRPERFTEEGEYIVTVANVERLLTPNGVEKAVITLADAKNRQVKDDLLNKDTVYWRLNQLVVASGLNIANGTELDFSKSGEFFNFVKGIVGLKVGILLKKEEYTSKQTGEQKFVLKVSKFTKASKGSSADEPF
jgi:hypothetical protein